MNKTAIWGGVILVSVLTGCVTLLAALGKETSAILGVINIFAVPVLAALGYSKISGLERTTEAVRQQTNGSQTQQLEFTREVVQQAIAIAMAQQPQAAPPERRLDSEPEALREPEAPPQAS